MKLELIIDLKPSSVIAIGVTLFFMYFTFFIYLAFKSRACVS